VKISIGSRLVDGPWGGGNLFVRNLTRILNQNGHEVVYNLEHNDIDGILLTDPRGRQESLSSFNHMDIERYIDLVNPNAIVVQRINECDERKGTKGINNLYLEASEIANKVVFVSEWLRSIYLEKGMDKAVADANAKLDAAEKAMKAKKKKKVKESVSKRYTVKEVRMWMKKLEENRYKKVYNSDARRVAWMINNEGVGLDEMPSSFRKRWTKAEYGREKYLAKEFKKYKNQQVNEGKLTEGGKMIQLQIPVRDKLKVDKILKKSGGKIGKHYDIGVGRAGTFILELDRKLENKVLELMIKNRIQVKEV